MFKAQDSIARGVCFLARAEWRSPIWEDDGVGASGVRSGVADGVDFGAAFFKGVDLGVTFSLSGVDFDALFGVTEAGVADFRVIRCFEGKAVVPDGVAELGAIAGREIFDPIVKIVGSRTNRIKSSRGCALKGDLLLCSLAGYLNWMWFFVLRVFVSFVC